MSSNGPCLNLALLQVSNTSPVCPHSLRQKSQLDHGLSLNFLNCFIRPFFNTPKQVVNFDLLWSNFSLVFLIPLSSSLSRLKLCLRTADAESTAAAVETAGCSNLIHCSPYLAKNLLKDLLNHLLHPSLCNKLQKPVRWLDDVYTLVVSNMLT